mgnify:CR=1 FL=1
MGFKKTIFAKKPVGRYNDSDGGVNPSGKKVEKV